MVATAVPRSPALWPLPMPDVRPSQYAVSTEQDTVNTGMAVEVMPTAMPWMMFVPWPVVEALAIDLTGSNW